MMNVLEITVALIILLIITLIILRRQKKCSSCSSKKTVLDKPKAPESVKPQQETTAVVNVEPSTANAQITDTKIVAPSAPSAIAQAAYPSENSSVLPQDSILKRHYLTHLCSMVEALAPPRPTESVLCRHYDMMIAAKIVQCLNDKKATEQLIFDYEKIGA